MYSIYAYIDRQNHPNVGINMPYMECLGQRLLIDHRVAWSFDFGLDPRQFRTERVVLDRHKGPEDGRASSSVTWKNRESIHLPRTSGQHLEEKRTRGARW